MSSAQRKAVTCARFLKWCHTIFNILHLAFSLRNSFWALPVDTYSIQSIPLTAGEHSSIWICPFYPWRHLCLKATEAVSSAWLLQTVPRWSPCTHISVWLCPSRRLTLKLECSLGIIFICLRSGFLKSLWSWVLGWPSGLLTFSLGGNVKPKTLSLKVGFWDFLGNPVAKTCATNAGDLG